MHLEQGDWRKPVRKLLDNLRLGLRSTLSKHLSGAGKSICLSLRIFTIAPVRLKGHPLSRQPPARVALDEAGFVATDKGRPVTPLQVIIQHADSGKASFVLSKAP
jgi:hypothetical protein